VAYSAGFSLVHHGARREHRDFQLIIFVNSVDSVVRKLEPTFLAPLDYKWSARFISHVLYLSIPNAAVKFATATLNQLPEKEKPMGDVGKKDKGNREEKKKAKLNPKEKRKLKIEKKKNKSQTGAIK